MTNHDGLQPYQIKIPDDELADLRDRLSRVRWAPEPAGGDKSYGVARLRELVEHWRDTTISVK
jgi:epoxide hydrolase